jgi:hypothetical protein
VDPPRAHVVLRLLNAGHHLPEALQSLLQNFYDGPVSVHARIDAATTDATEQHLERAALARHQWDWHIEWSRRHEDLWNATASVYEEIDGGVVYTLDADNRFEPDRLTKGWSVHPHRRLLCCDTVNWAGWSGVVAGKVPLNRTVPTAEDLLKENRYDSLNQRLDGKFCRDVLAPLMRLEPEEAIPDYFANLVAARLSVVCCHEYVAGTYASSPGSLSRRAITRTLDARTRALFLRVDQHDRILELAAKHLRDAPLRPSFPLPAM